MPPPTLSIKLKLLILLLSVITRLPTLLVTIMYLDIKLKRFFIDQKKNGAATRIQVNELRTAR